MRSLLILVLLAGCAGAPVDTSLEPVRGPTVAHVAPPGPYVEGFSLQFGATAVDPDGVGRVSLYYKADAQPLWTKVDLENTGYGWVGSVPDTAVLAPGLSYYFEAVDNSPYLGTTLYPIGGEAEPLHLDVLVQGRPLPWIEDFEGAATAGNLFDLDWSEVGSGFPGYPWDVTGNQHDSGAWSAGHNGGLEGVDAIDDWLVSPAIDFSTEADIQVTWSERGDNVDRMLAGGHSLWISVGDPDPLAGDFVQVAELAAPPEDAWAPAATFDVSEWAGSRVAYLAWRYNGQYADSWYIDDVEVRRLTADLELIDTTWTPLEPGGYGTLTLTVENKTRMPAFGVVVTPEADPAAAVFDGPGVLGDVNGFETVTLDLGLTIDPTHPDNAYLPVSFSATDGVDTWLWDADVVVGERSFATIDVTTDVLGYFVATLGAGDPTRPDVAIPVAADIIDPGAYSFEVDLTDYWPVLPPGPGPDRWWLTIDSTSPGALRRFEIAFDGSVVPSSDLGPFVGEQARTFYHPAPPVPAVDGLATIPVVVEPGSTVTVITALWNFGEPTIGATTARLVTSDPAVTLVSADPQVVSDSGWPTGVVSTHEWTILVDPDHRNSFPVALSVVVEDEVESFDAPFEIAVPWPVLDLAAAAVDDFDGVLTSGESAEIELSVANVGDLPTFGAVSCNLVPREGDVTTTVLAGAQSFGTLEVFEVEEEGGFDVQVGAGADGDSANFALECADTRTTYEVPVDFALGLPGWQWIDATPDPFGDAQNDYPFDIIGGRYRSDGSVLEIEITSGVPINPATTFIEAWGVSNGAAWQYYQIVAQSGIGTVRGYEDGVFVTLTNPVVTTYDDDTVRMTIDLTNLDLAQGSIELGFSAGFCVDTYYCDHWPDAWGDPYVSGFDIASWFDLRW